MGLHQIGLGQHTSADRKVLKNRSDQHQVIAGSGAAPSLADTATLTAPDGVSLLVTLVMAQGPHAGLTVFLVTLFGQDHPIVIAMREVNT